MTALLPLPIVLPLLGAAASILAGRSRRLQRAIALGVLTTITGVAVAILVDVDRHGPAATQAGGWPAPLGITLVADRLRPRPRPGGRGGGRSGPSRPGGRGRRWGRRRCRSGSRRSPGARSARPSGPAPGPDARARARRPCRRAVAPRTPRPRSLADRALALDGLIVCGVATLVTRAVQTGDGSFLPVAVVFTLVGFIGTASIARFIERQGR